MAFDYLPEELVCLIFQELLKHRGSEDYKSFRAFASTCHRLNTISMRIKPSSRTLFVNANHTCEEDYCDYKYCYFNDRRVIPVCVSDYSLTHEWRRMYDVARNRFLVSLAKKEQIISVPDEDLRKFGDLLPFFWLRLAKLKYNKVYVVRFYRCILREIIFLNYMHKLIRADCNVKENYDSITKVELDNISLTIKWLDRFLLLVENIKILCIDSKLFKDVTMSEYELNRLVETRSPRKLEELSLKSAYIGFQYRMYFAKVCPAELFSIENIFGRLANSYDSLKLYLHTNLTIMRRFITNNKHIYHEALADSLLSGIEVELST